MADKDDDDSHSYEASGSDSEDNSENERNDSTIPSIPSIEPQANGGNGFCCSQLAESVGGNWVNKSGDFLVPYFGFRSYWLSQLVSVTFRVFLKRWSAVLDV